MQVVQHKYSSSHHQYGSNSSSEPQQMITTMPDRAHQPLTFSVDDRLAEQHLTRLDLCSQNLQKIDRLSNNIEFNIILLDRNEISKIENLESCSQLVQLSISHNRLVDIRLLNRLRSLQKLNLSYNDIDSIDCLRTLQNLVMINISNNNIHSIAVLNECHALQSLDASGNSIQHIEDLSRLTSLKYLNLDKNFIDTLISAPRYWPKTLHTLVISDNEIQDLTEVSYLSSFIDLNTLYIVDNPCLSVIDGRHGRHQPFDYRPYILNWCLSIHNLDGVFTTRKETLKAEWLLSQGKGRSFVPGEHAELVQYLTKVCGTDADQRDDLHLSRIMQKLDMYTEQRRSTETLEYMMATSDTMRDANETLSKNTQGRSQQSTIFSESDFHRLNGSHAVSTVDDHMISAYQQMRTPSPGFIKPASATTNYMDEKIPENNSNHRYSTRDNRPIKPLDQNMLKTKLNEYPVDNHTNTTQPTANVSSQLVYNANRYSPKTTKLGPSTSSTVTKKSNRTIMKRLERNNRTKRPTLNSSNSNAHRSLNHSYEKNTHRLTTINKVKNRERSPSTDSDDNRVEEEVQLKSATTNRMLSTRSTTMTNNDELQRLTASVDTMRTSILQAYLQLHERFTKTTELQTSALSALWKTCETQTLNHSRETERLMQENRLLNQRIRDLEARLNSNETKSVVYSSNPTLSHNPNLYPPLRAHISKRDTKSFFLHWIPNPLNEHRAILGYRIFIDDVFKGSIDSGRFEAIIDYIRDEGEYKIKLRTYNEQGESADSNVVIARFRRQHSDRTQLNCVTDNFLISPRDQENVPSSKDEQHQNDPSVTPEKNTVNKNADEKISPFKLSPNPTSNENVVRRKPPKSPTSSPNRSEKTSPNNRSCSKVLFENNNNDEPSSAIRTKRSPTRIGVMSRLAKSPHGIKRNHILSNPLPTQFNNHPTEVFDAPNSQVKTANRIITFQPDPISNDQGHISAQKVPIISSDISYSMALNRLSTCSDTVSSDASPPPPIPPRTAKTNDKTLVDQQS